METRKATAADAPAIARAEDEIFPDAWSERDICDTICSEGAMCYCAVTEGELLGYIIGRTVMPEGEIYRIAVLPKYRKRGIGYRLLDYCVKSERGKGLECLFLEVRSKNAPAIALYRAYGFTECGIRRGYYKNPDDDAILMLKANKQDLVN